VKPRPGSSYPFFSRKINKKTRDENIRTNYLVAKKANMTKLTPTTSEGRLFGAIKISVDGKRVGKIGTGFGEPTMTEVVERFLQDVGSLTSSSRVSLSTVRPGMIVWTQTVHLCR
jgi:hypothetical protein